MTRVPGQEAEYTPTSYWHWAQEGVPQEHAVGTSCDNLVALSEPSYQQAPLPSPRRATSQLQQPSSPVPKPDRSEACGDAGTSASRSSSASLSGSPRDSGSASSCLDQYAPMLPSNPVQQLPLLPTTTTSSTVRVAAWLLDDAAAAAANNAARVGALLDGPGEDLAGAALEDASGDECADLALLELHQQLEDPDAPAVAPTAAAQAQVQGVHTDCEGYKETSYYSACAAGRRSLDGFMSRPVQHGDALNNYVASLY